jgi:TonB-linked SusC/RagA family outer membrane protein
MRRFFALFAVLMLSGVLASAQDHSVKGRVTGPDGNSLPGITVQVQGSNTATATNSNGEFELSVPSNATLVFTGVGYTEQAIKVGSRPSIDVTLEANNRRLNEVVVTALGIKRESRSLGYSTATVNSEQLNESKPVNVAQGLIGRVSGAQISVINNGVSPEVRIQLRGERHINSDNQPLIIVDGMEVRSDFLTSLNPEDINTVSVLKGASAAALYGSEATNGVMIITTKRGASNGKPVISVSQTHTIEKLAYFPALQTTYSGYGGESGTLFSGTPYQFQAINPYTGFVNSIPFENQQYGPPYDGNPALGYIGSPNEKGDVYKTPFRPQSPDPRKAFFQTGRTEQTDLSLSSGDSKNSNFIGIQYVDVKGVTPKDASNRASVRFAGLRTYGIFSYDYSMNYSYQYSNTVGNDITDAWPIYWTLLNTLPNVPINSLKDWQDPSSFASLSNYYNAYYINPWWQVDNSRNTTKTNNLQGVLSMHLRPKNWIDINYRLSAQISNVVTKNWRNEADFTPYAISDPWSESGTPASGNIAGSVFDESTLYKRIQQDITATFRHSFGDLDAQLIIGNTIWDRYSNDQQQGVGNGTGLGGNPNSQKSNLTLPNIYNIAYYAGIPSVGGAISETRLIGGYGDLTLGYKNSLFLEGNFRRDYSSLLAPGHNSYNVWAVNGSWVFSNTISTLKNSKALSYGKIRAAYSETGQITLSPYSTVNTFGVSSGYPYGGLASLSISGTYNNPALVPEKTIEKEAGIELGFLDNRVNVGATYYFDDNLNQLFPVSVTTATGFSHATVNAARTNSTGWEFDASATPVRSLSGFSWKIAGNLAIQTTTVKSLYANAKQFNIGNDNYAIVGMPFPQLYVSDLSRDSASGKVIVDPNTGLPGLSSTSVAVGRSTPKYILGLTTNLTFKNLTLNIVGDYRGGYVFYNNSEQNLDFSGASVHTTTNGRQNFIYPNSVVKNDNGKYVDNTNVYVQDGNIGFWAYSNYRTAGTSYVENAAAWKIRTISLQYDFTSLLSRYPFIHGLQVSAICNNAFMFRPSENDFTDPEFNNGNVNGLGYNTYYQLPPTRQFSFVLNVKF